MSKKIVSGVTQQFYYSSPSDLDLITTSPTREAIFQYLTQVLYEDFPDFIFDILIKVEKHTPGDITDGPGDEKQDIFTITPEGKKCITQCKHKDKLDGKYSGDELDRIVATCLRKECTVANFVTNGDLSPQAKNYVNDKEYLRGWPGEGEPLIIDYWNGYKIWERIKGNQDILNKWFSGMGQLHGLRNFKFNISVLQMPFEIERVQKDLENILSRLLKKKVITQNDKDYIATLSNGIEITIRKWYQFASEWELRLNTPVKSPNFWHHPLYSWQVDVRLPQNSDKYSPLEIKEEIIKYLFHEMPACLSQGHWWHISASQGKTFVFLHDIGEPRQIYLDSARTFIRTTKGIFPELVYCDLEGSNYKVKPNSNGEKEMWIDQSTGVEIVQFFEQSLNPVETFHYQQIQLERLDEIKGFEFRAVENVTKTELMRIRRILSPEWIAFTDNNNNFFWCFPSDTKPQQKEITEKKLKVLGLKVLLVSPKARTIILKNLAHDLPPVSLATITELAHASIPIDLKRRGIWINKDMTLKKKIDEHAAMKLLEFKFSFEKNSGFDHLQGKKELRSHTSELPSILFDIFSVRCNIMLDIAILANPISINIRFFDETLIPNIELTKKAIKEFEKIYVDIQDLLKGYL